MPEFEIQRKRISARAILLIILLAVIPASKAAARTRSVMSQCDYFRNQCGFPRSQEETGRIEKSGTPRLFMMLHGVSVKATAFQAVYQTLDRPVMDTYVDSPAGHFRVHYDISGTDAPSQTDIGGNGVPDYVDSTLVYLEYAWGLMSGMGYDAPISDAGLGGSTAVDVYLVELSTSRIYGYTSPDFGSFASSAYLVFDNDYSESIYPTKGLNALKVTSAHEFFHVTHFSYYGGSDVAWWMEQTAVWFEDYAWNDINDYLNYLSAFLGNRNLPLDTANGSIEYGAALFAFMLEKQYDPSILRSAWNTFRLRQSGTIGLLNGLISGGLATALADLAVWCYFTGDRASTNFFRDAPLITAMVTVENTLSRFPANGALLCPRYCFKYVEIAPPSGIDPGDPLLINLTSRNGGTWTTRLILYNSPTDYDVKAITGSEYILDAPRFYKSAVIVASNTASGAGEYELDYSVTAPPYTLGQNYPNPFNNKTVIPYTVPKASPVTIKIFNLTGQTVYTLVDAYHERGAFTATFDTAGLSLSSGVYFAVLQSGGTRITRKMMFLK